MDTTKVKNWNEAKYRIVHWVLEKMREVPIGKLLADGYLPSSILEINALLNEVTITALLPFESYEDGVFIHENTHASCYFLQGFLNRDVAKSVFDGLLVGQILQICMIKNKNKNTQYVAALSQKVDMKGEQEPLVSFNQQMEGQQRMDAQGLLALLYPFLNTEETVVPQYEDDVLLCRQLGDSDTQVTKNTIDIKNNNQSKSFRIYTLRCLGWDENGIIHEVLESLSTIEEFIVTSNYCRDEKGFLWGQLIIVVRESENTDEFVKKIFSDRGWLIEKECAHPLLVLQACLPMCMSFFINDLLKEHHRFIRFDTDEAIKVMPLLVSWSGVA